MLVALLQVSTFPSWKGQALLSFRLPQRIQKVPRRAYAADRDEVAVSEEKTKDMALPLHGMQEREQYTMHGHFRVLKGLLRGAERIRVYMDQDSGLRAALLAAFAERIKARTADGWYVSVLKESTIHQKENAVQKAKLRLADAAKRFPGLPDGQLMVELMKEEMARAKALGQYDDQWLAHPVPNMSEPAKRVCWLTDYGGYDPDHLARLSLKGSLHAIDRFFMQTRRLLSMAERSLATASKARRVWYGYSAYKPENLTRILEIFRVYYNYCRVGEDKKTPAMRLGLAKAPIKPEDILYFEGWVWRHSLAADSRTTALARRRQRVRGKLFTSRQGLVEQALELVESDGTGRAGDQPALAINNEGCRRAQDPAELAHDLALLVPHDLERHGVLGQAAFDQIGPVVGHGDCDHLQAARLVAPECLHQLRLLGQADGAGGGPEVHQDDLAAQLREVQWLPVDRGGP